MRRLESIGKQWRTGQPSSHIRHLNRWASCIMRCGIVSVLFLGLPCSFQFCLSNLLLLGCCSSGSQLPLTSFREGSRQAAFLFSCPQSRLDVGAWRKWLPQSRLDGDESIRSGFGTGYLPLSRGTEIRACHSSVTSAKLSFAILHEQSWSCSMIEVPKLPGKEWTAVFERWILCGKRNSTVVLVLHNCMQT